MILRKQKQKQQKQDEEEEEEEEEEKKKKHYQKIHEFITDLGEDQPLERLRGTRERCFQYLARINEDLKYEPVGLQKLCMQHDKVILFWILTGEEYDHRKHPPL